MKRVAANLAPLLTCPSFWLWHVLGTILCIPAFLYACSSNAPDTGLYVAAFVLPFWSATVLTSLQRDLLVSPVSFCLPGHREALRRTSLLVGIIASQMASLPVLTHPGLDGLSLLWAIWSAFCFGLIIYLLVVASLFVVGTAMASLGSAMAMGFVLVEFPTARFLVQEVALFAPGWNTVVLAALGMFTWRRIGSMDLARRICGGRFLSLQMAWRRSAYEEFGASVKLESLSKRPWGAREWFLQQCFDRIIRRLALSFRRHLAATQYELAGSLIPPTPRSVLFTVLAVLVFLVAAGYAPLRENRPQTLEATEANIVYIASCVLGGYLPIPLFTTMLLPAGRRERFWNAIIIAFSGGLAVLASSLLFYVLFLGMGGLAPPFSIGGEVRVFRPAQLEPVFVPLAVLPMMFLLKLVCKKWLLVPQILLIFIAGLVIIKGHAALRGLSPSAIIVIVSVSWAILVGVLYTYSFHRDLVQE